MTCKFLGSARTWLVIAPSLLLFVGCTVPTPYQAANGDYGYRDQQIEDNRYRVSFEGNASTERSDVQNYLLYRAAELTIQNGYDYFTIVDRDLERSTRYFSSGYVDDFSYPGFHRDRRGYRRYVGPRHVSGQSYPVSEYTSSADIVMAEGDKPKDDANAYDALDVLQRLQPTIRRTEPASTAF